jgi:hypothetical protein
MVPGVKSLPNLTPFSHPIPTPLKVADRHWP